MEISTDLSSEIKQRIEQAIPNSQVDVILGGDRHYALSVVSDAFAGLAMVKQHQMVYAAINDLMAGNDAPIHAIDKMDLRAN